jgi:hypothetical protein
MNICINYYGQIRDIEDCKYMFDNYIFETRNKYHILFTTWEDENIKPFIEKFSESFISTNKQVDESAFDKGLLTKYTIDRTQRKDKTLFHYLKGLYIRNKTIDTILMYEKNKNIKFDLIITLRIDTTISNALSDFYKNVMDKNICVANEPRFNIYDTGSYPDCLCFSNRDNMLNILDCLKDIEKCCVKDTNFFHPETTSYNIIINKKLDITYCLFNSFSCLYKL